MLFVSQERPAGLFVEGVGDDGSQVGNVFVASYQEGKLGVIMSDSGFQETAARQR